MQRNIMEIGYDIMFFEILCKGGALLKVLTFEVIHMSIMYTFPRDYGLLNIALFC